MKPELHQGLSSLSALTDPHCHRALHQLTLHMVQLVPLTHCTTHTAAGAFSFMVLWTSVILTYDIIKEPIFYTSPPPIPILQLYVATQHLQLTHAGAKDAPQTSADVGNSLDRPICLSYGAGCELDQRQPPSICCDITTMTYRQSGTLYSGVKV